MPHNNSPKNTNRNHKALLDLPTFIALALCAVMFFGFFFGSSYFVDSYTTAKLWDLGHLCFFFVFSLLLLRLRPEPLWYCGLGKTSLIALLAGSVIEALQNITGRQASLHDIAFNLIGAGSASLWVYRKKRYKGKIILSTIYSAMIILALMPLLIGAGNLLLGRWQYPVLLSFDYALEQMRLTGNASISFQQYQGRQGAIIRFGDDQYSGFTLTEVPSDWSRRQQLIIELNNLAKTPLPLTCRIHDIYHNQAYNDRFNQSWSLLPGRQYITIALSDVVNAPQHRSLDSTQIAALGCFTIKNLHHPAIFLQRIYLR